MPAPAKPQPLPVALPHSHLTWNNVATASRFQGC
jgi:hypothetical protein